MAGVDTMSEHQPGIVAPLCKASRYVFLQTRPDVDARAALESLAARRLDERTVVGLGSGLVAAIGQSIDGLRSFPALTGAGVRVPSTPTDLWISLAGDDQPHLQQLQLLHPRLRRRRQQHQRRPQVHRPPCPCPCVRRPPSAQGS